MVFIYSFFINTHSTGERLCDHLSKAIETQKETEGQLNLLLSKLNETGLVLNILFTLLQYCLLQVISNRPFLAMQLLPVPITQLPIKHVDFYKEYLYHVAGRTF